MKTQTSNSTIQISKSRFFLLGLAILCIPYCCWLYLGANSYITIHDNLDHQFVYIQQLLNSPNLFGFNLDGQIESVMHGVPRTFYRSGFSITFLLFALFKPITAYIIQHFIVHLIGYGGMFLLLSSRFIKSNNLLVLVTAICFGAISYTHIQCAASIAGQPILLFAFMNLLEGQKKHYNWFIIILFPFFSFLPVTLPFMLPILALLGFYSWRKSKQIPWIFLAGMLLLIGINVLVEFNLLYASFFSDIQSHRTEWNKIVLNGGLPNLIDLCYLIFNRLMYTQYHSGTLSAIPILISCVWFFIQKKRSSIILYLLTLALAIVCWEIISDYLTYKLSEKISFLKTFNVQRFYYLSPFVWLLLFAITLNELSLDSLKKKLTAGLLILVSFAIILNGNGQLMDNSKLILGIQNKTTPTFQQFYDTELFAIIKDDLNISKCPPTERVICVGLHPSVVQYNDIPTLDSYQNNYPLEYKHAFRKIIATELDKCPELKSYYDYWGSRCYAFSSELKKQYLWDKTSEKVIENLEFEWDSLLKMGGKYILSSVAIDIGNHPRLKLVNDYSLPNSYWRIYAYQVI